MRNSHINVDTVAMTQINSILTDRIELFMGKRALGEFWPEIEGCLA